MDKRKLDLSKKIEELVVEYGVDLTEVVNAALDLLSKEAEKDD